MRRRSGALHCDSELDFMQLAEAAHDHMGIFYDQRMNRKIMTTLRHAESPWEVSNPEHSAQKPKTEYKGFDFGLESEAEREEREQLSRANLETTRVLNVAIVTRDVAAMHRRLRRGERVQQGRNFDLAVEKHGSTIVKFWIVEKQHRAGEGSLIELYLRHCQAIIQEGKGTKISTKVGEWRELLRQVERRVQDA